MGDGALDLDDLRQALARLYSPTELGRTRLATLLLGDTGDPAERGQALRRLLLDTIEGLRPTGRTHPSASEFRAYECVTLRYVSSYSAEDIGEQLSLSRRQVYRDLQCGEKRLLEMLQAHRQAAARQRAESSEPDPLAEEIKALVRRPEAVQLVDLVRGAMAGVLPLARERGVALEYDGPEAGVVVKATPGILREAIVQILSAIVQGTKGGTVRLRIVATGGEATLELPLPPEEQGPPGLLEGALLVLTAQGVSHELTRTPEASLLRLRLPQERRYRVLIVEDNPSAAALYERYLENSEWEPVLVPHPRLAADLAASRQARAIILDIMMPETDGWSVLQRLRVDPRVASIPVIICSVVNDQALGRALGASAYLTKPVGRPALLHALEQALRSHRRAAAG